MKVLLLMTLVALAAGAAGAHALLCLTTEVATWMAANRAALAEVRAVWVVRHDLASPAAVRVMVEGAAASGFNTLLVQVRGRGDAVYRSAIEPRAEFLRDVPDFDALQMAVETAHDHGLAVHAWVNAHLVWGRGAPPRNPRHLVNAHPEWLAVPRALGWELYHRDPRDPLYVRQLIEYAARNSNLVEGLYASPFHPEVQERLLAVWIEPGDPLTTSRGSITATFATPPRRSTIRARRWSSSGSG